MDSLDAMPCGQRIKRLTAAKEDLALLYMADEDHLSVEGFRRVASEAIK